MNRCRFRKLIHRYCDGELINPERERCENHLQHCETCRTLLQELLSLRTLCMMKPPSNPAAGFHDRVYARIQDHGSNHAKPVRIYSIGTLSRKFAPLAACFLFLFGGLAAVLSISQRDAVDPTGLRYYTVESTDATAAATFEDITGCLLTEQERALIKSEDSKAVDAFYAMLEDAML